VQPLRCAEANYAHALVHRREAWHTIPYHTTLHHTIPYHTTPHHTTPYHTIPYHTIPYHTIPYHTIPYHTIPFAHAAMPGGRRVVPRVDVRDERPARPRHLLSLWCIAEPPGAAHRSATRAHPAATAHTQGGGGGRVFIAWRASHAAATVHCVCTSEFCAFRARL
jgi:hypothetical protein